MNILSINEDGIIVNMEQVDHDESGLLVHEVTYRSSGLLVKGLLVRLEGENELPPLLYLRGGIRSVGMVRLVRMAQFARRGYAVFAPYYRGNAGGEGREDFAGEDRYDAYHATKIFGQLEGIADCSISVLGFSRGAVMALLTARDCDRIGGVAVWGGVSDLWLTYEERVDLRRMLKRVVGHPKKHREAYLSRSPVCWATFIRTPIMIVHGKEDEKVSVTHAYRLQSALKAAGRSPRMHVVEDMKHVFTPEADKQAMDAVFEFFETCREGD